MQAQTSPCGRLMSIKDVARETSLHRATIYRKVASGNFPRPRSLGGSRVAWREADIECWKADPVGWRGDG
tara:strand:+ start:23 stop:232 length:210 start_codon:yes stop_codon:yes gene_type:complete